MALMYDRKALGRLMGSRGLSDAAVAPRARVSRRQMIYLRRGFSEPRASTLARLCVAIGATPNDFFKGDGHA